MKKLLSVFMGVLLAVSLVFAAACGDNVTDTPTGPIDYTVTVQDTAENPVSRAAVSLVQNGTTVRSLVTGDNGQVVLRSLPLRIIMWSLILILSPQVSDLRRANM